MILTRNATRGGKLTYQVYRQPLSLRSLVIEGEEGGKLSGSFRGGILGGDKGKFQRLSPSSVSCSSCRSTTGFRARLVGGGCLLLPPARRQHTVPCLTHRLFFFNSQAFLPRSRRGPRQRLHPDRDRRTRPQAVAQLDLRGDRQVPGRQGNRRRSKRRQSPPRLLRQVGVVDVREEGSPGVRALIVGQGRDVRVRIEEPQHDHQLAAGPRQQGSRKAEAVQSRIAAGQAAQQNDVCRPGRRPGGTRKQGALARGQTADKGGRLEEKPVSSKPKPDLFPDFPLRLPPSANVARRRGPKRKLQRQTPHWAHARARLQPALCGRADGNPAPVSRAPATSPVDPGSFHESQPDGPERFGRGQRSSGGRQRRPGACSV